MFSDETWSKLEQQFRLTPREREVAERVFHDCGYREIGRELGISHHTVEEYFRRVKSKFGVCSRGQFYLCVFREFRSE